MLVSLSGIIITSNINAISLKRNSEENIQIHDKINCDPLLIENGIVIGRTVMTIKSKPGGLLQYVNISIEGEVIKNIKTGRFGLFIIIIPIGRYKFTASKPGFYNSYRYLTLYWFKPFAIVSFKLEKIGWN